MRIKQVFIALDQFLNTLVKNGFADETLSARAFRMTETSNGWAKFHKIVDKAAKLVFNQDNHCYESYMSELQRNQMPKDYRTSRLDTAFFTSVENGKNLITGERRQYYLDFFNAVLGANRQLYQVKMITEINASGQPLAVVLFGNFNGSNMEVAIASQVGWTASRRFLYECFNYAFNTCGASRVSSVVDVRNEKAINFNLRLGFIREFDENLKNWFVGSDGILFSMQKDQCKWIRI